MYIIVFIFGIDDIILSPYDRLCFESRPLVRQDHIEARLIQNKPANHSNLYLTIILVFILIGNRVRCND